MFIQPSRKAFCISDFTKTDIYKLTDQNLTAKLIFARYIPLYSEAKFKHDQKLQKSYLELITGCIIIFFSQDLQINPFFKKKLLECVGEIAEEQVFKTPDFIISELKQLYGKITNYLEKIGNLISNTCQNAQNMKIRFSEASQTALIDFKKEAYTNINHYIKILESLIKDIKYDTSFSEENIKKAILMQNPAQRVAKLLTVNQNIQQQQTKNCFSSQIHSDNSNTNKQNEDNLNQFSEKQQKSAEIPINSEDKKLKQDQVLSETIKNENSNENCIDTSEDDDDPDYPFCDEIPVPEIEIEYAFDVTKIMDSRSFAFHILSSGITPTKATRFLNHLGIKCYSLSTIYSAQNIISKIIIQTADESVKFHRFRMPKGISVTFDGAWSHVRKSYQHLAVLIESKKHKIVASQCLWKNYRSFEGNYEWKKPGNLMEINALKLMSKILLDERIVNFTSDGDIKITKFIQSLDRKQPLTTTKDPGHALLSISRTIKKLNSKCKNIFTPLIPSFEKFVKNVVLKIQNDDFRVRIYQNISLHYSGVHDPELCIHNENSSYSQFFDTTNPKSLEIFENFLKRTSKIIHDIAPGNSTQINESFNHHTKKFINKLYSFRSSYPIRTAISILDWNEKYYVFEILKRLESTQVLYTVFLDSVRKEIEEKKKAKKRRATERWKFQHKLEKLKKMKQTSSTLPSAHQTKTIIKEAVNIIMGKSDQKNESDDEESFFDDDYTSEDEDDHSITYDESSDLCSDEIDDDLEWTNVRYKELLEPDRYDLLMQNGSFYKHPLSITCGINNTNRNCFVSAPVQLLARVNANFIDKRNYKSFFDTIESSEISIPIDLNLFQMIDDFYPGEEDAMLTLDFLINELFIENIVNKECYIKYVDSLTSQINIVKYNIKTAIDTSSIHGVLVKSYEIFCASLVAQIGDHNIFGNIVSFVPPPVIFIELWKHNDRAIKTFEFDDFITKVNGQQYKYHCLGTIIRADDHFKNVVFDNDHTILIDDALVSDLSHDENLNIYKQFELDDLNDNTILVAYQINNDQIDQYFNENFHDA